MSSDTRKAVGLILIFIALLFFLLGMAARSKMNFHGREQGARIGFTAAGVFVGAGVVMLAISGRGRQRS